MAMSEKMENLLVKLLHFGVLAITAWTLITVDFTGRGSIVAQLRGKEPSAADRNALAAPGKANLQRAEGGDRSLIVAEQQTAPAQHRERALSAVELAAQVPTVENRAPTSAKASHKLNSTLAGLDDPSRRSSQRSNAGISAGPAYIEASAVASPSPAGTAYTNEPPSEDARPQRRAVASRYSGTGRNDMMGNSGGAPVYNIKGKD